MELEKSVEKRWHFVVSMRFLVRDEIDRRTAPRVLVSVLDIATDVLLRVVIEKLHVRLAQENVRDYHLRASLGENTESPTLAACPLQRPF